MFENSGGNIKSFAKFLFWLSVIISVILFIGTIIYVPEGTFLYIIILMVFLLASYIICYILTGFGELVQNSKEIKDALKSDAFKEKMQDK